MISRGQILRQPADDEAKIFAWLEEKATMSRFLSAVRQLVEIEAAEPGRYKRLKVLVVRNFTIEPIEPFLRLAAYRAGISMQLAYSGYDPDVTADEDMNTEPDIVIVSQRLEELVPMLTDDAVTSREAISDLADDVVHRIMSRVRAIRARSSAEIFVHNFVLPLRPAAGLADSQSPNGQLNTVRVMNLRLAEAVPTVSGAHILDIDHLFAQVGLQDCYDGRGDRLSDAPFSKDALQTLADALVRHIKAAEGPAVKCIIVDCDNTLWGGVVGEDGIGGIELGRTGPGRKYRDLQVCLRDLRRRGAVLALCTKNEPADVLEVLRTHPDCVLREDDFVAVRITWDDKAQNIASIAEELNLSLAHLAFIDDNPVECGWVRAHLPAVRVIQWPTDLGDGTLEDLGLFDTLELTDEDRTRTEMYRAESGRQEARADTTSLDDYLRSLDMVATIGMAERQHLPRLAQLTQKTNQFNLCTRRYEVPSLEKAIEDPDVRVVWLDLCDRFGSNGIVGCGILRRRGGSAFIDTLLLSCRVLGRNAEALLVRCMAELAASMGTGALVGEYIPSERNAQVAGLYGRLGFTGPDVGDRGSLWHWDLAAGLPQIPDWFKTVDLFGSQIER